MDIFSIDLTIGEIQLLRQSLDIITINGKDAKVVASLQSKLEQELAQITKAIQEAEALKQKKLRTAVEKA
jgi:hypothetical protein